MVMQKIADGNGGKWIVKKKFSFAAVAGLIGIVVILKGLQLSEEVNDVVLLMGSLTTFASFLLGLVFAADIVDKKANGGGYDPTTE